MQQVSRTNSEPIPGYRLLERLGRGGYGEVWKAEAPGGMHKAIKFVFGDMDAAGDQGKAAEQEFRSLNRIKTIRHPFLLSLERIEVIDGQLLIVMELADRDLLDRFNESVESGLSGIPRRELLIYMGEAAEALDLMNLEYQIQHLDIKPQNLFLVHRHVKVADFGLAKDLEGARADLTGGITPMYAPPETFEGWVSRQSDQYSLAIVYMEMLTGKRPFNGSNTRQLILQHMTAVPDLSPLPPADRDPVAKALAKKPEDRFPTCSDFIRALGESARRETPAAEFVVAPSVFPSLSPVVGRQTERGLPSKTKAMPALVTPKSKLGSSIPAASTSRKHATEHVPVQTALPLAPHEQIGTGVLVPTLLVGVGGTGLSFLRSFRNQLIERFGRPTLPHLRWLFIDTDPDAAQLAVSGSPLSALEPDDIVLTPLQRPVHYLSREGIPPVETWMRQEDLFRMPKTPATEGVRCIGRLALCDHYSAIAQRIRKSVETLKNPAALGESQRITGLDMWTNVPRVVVATSLEGGTGSGMFLDLTYIIRRQLLLMGSPNSRVLGLLGVPAWVAQSSQNRAVMNTRASLEELNHFHHSAMEYWATFDSQEGPVVDGRRPFDRVTFVPLPGNHDAVECDRAGALAAQILHAELFTPIGRSTLPETKAELEKPFTLVGMQRLVWPRSTVLRVASSMLIQRTLAAWAGKSSKFGGTHPGDLIDAQWEERQLSSESLKAVMRQHLMSALGETYIQAVNTALTPLVIRESDETEPQRVRKAFRNLVKLVGRPDQDETENPHAVGTTLKPKLREIGAAAESRLTSCILGLIEQPGLRLAGAEEAIRVLRERLSREVSKLGDAAAELEETASRHFASIHELLVAAVQEQDPRLGKNWSHSVTEALAPLQAWAIARVKWQINLTACSVYRIILGRLPDIVHEVGVVRAQLGVFTKTIEQGALNLIMDDGICRFVFPDGSKSVSESAKKLVENITPNHLREFEHTLQGRIRHICRGIVGVCARPKEHGSAFLSVLTEQATWFLDAQISSGSKALPSSTLDPDRVVDLLDRAQPVSLGQGKPGVAFVGVREANSATSDLVRQMCPGELHDIPGTDEFFIWREFRSDSVKAFAKLCAEPTQKAGTVHSRQDVEWIPL